MPGLDVEDRRCQEESRLRQIMPQTPTSLSKPLARRRYFPLSRQLRLMNRSAKPQRRSARPDGQRISPSAARATTRPDARGVPFTSTGKVPLRTRRSMTGTSHTGRVPFGASSGNSCNRGWNWKTRRVIDASMAYACADEAISRSVAWIVRRRANQTTSGIANQDR